MRMAFPPAITELCRRGFTKPQSIALHAFEVHIYEYVYIAARSATNDYDLERELHKAFCSLCPELQSKILVSMRFPIELFETAIKRFKNKEFNQSFASLQTCAQFDHPPSRFIMAFMLWHKLIPPILDDRNHMAMYVHNLLREDTKYAPEQYMIGLIRGPCTMRGFYQASAKQGFKPAQFFEYYHMKCDYTATFELATQGFVLAQYTLATLNEFRFNLMKNVHSKPIPKEWKNVEQMDEDEFITRWICSFIENL